MKRYLTFISFLIFLVVPPTFAEDMDRRAIVGVTDAFVDAWNNHDAAALGDLFVEDGDFVNYVGILMKDKTSVVNGHKFVLEKLKASQLRNYSTLIRLQEPTTAVTRFHWLLQVDGANPGSASREGWLLFVLKKNSSGNWKILAGQNTDIDLKALSPNGVRTDLDPK